jgi:hypothetical protein
MMTQVQKLSRLLRSHRYMNKHNGPVEFVITCSLTDVGYSFKQSKRKN